MKHGVLDKYPVIYRTPIAWGEMDALGHVNNIYYFRYFESARSAYFQRMGLWDYSAQTRIGVILHSTSCRFRLPLTFPDKIAVGTRVVDVQSDRFSMEYLIVSEMQQAVAAEGTGLVVVYDYNRNQKCVMPKEMRERIEEIERRTTP
jgi:acyl-CoA thioester hydrolase